MRKLGRLGFLLQVLGTPILIVAVALLTPKTGIMPGLGVIFYSIIGWAAFGLTGIILGIIEIRFAKAFAIECKEFGADPPKLPSKLAYISIGIGIVPFFLGLCWWWQ